MRDPLTGPSSATEVPGRLDVAVAGSAAGTDGLATRSSRALKCNRAAND